MADQPLKAAERGLHPGGEDLLYLTDERLRQGVEMLFFAYRAFTSDPDRILAEAGLGRAHHRALHFVGRHPGIPVVRLLAILGVSKQSLYRVLRELLERDLVIRSVGADDRRTRLLRLSDGGKALDRRLSEVQRRRVRQAFRAAGADAVAGFHLVLEHLIDESEREAVIRVISSGRVR